MSSRGEGHDDDSDDNDNDYNANSGCHILSAYFTLVAMIKALHIFFHLFLSTNPWGKYHCYYYLTF